MGSIREYGISRIERIKHEAGTKLYKTGSHTGLYLLKQNCIIALGSIQHWKRQVLRNFSSFQAWMA